MARVLCRVLDGPSPERLHRQSRALAAVDADPRSVAARSASTVWPRQQARLASPDQRFDRRPQCRLRWKIPSRVVVEDDEELEETLSDRVAKLDEAVGDTWEAQGAALWVDLRLGKLGLQYPGPVQARATRAILETDGDVAIRSPTGSGKTLAFMAPIFTALTEALEVREAATIDEIQHLATARPQAACEALAPALRTSERTLALSRPCTALAPDRGGPLADRVDDALQDLVDRQCVPGAPHPVSDRPRRRPRGAPRCAFDSCRGRSSRGGRPSARE